MKLKKNLETLKPYVAGKPSSQKGTIKLNANECPFDLPQKLYKKSARIRSLNRYHEPSGIDLRTKLAQNLNLDSQQLILGNGSGELIQVFLQAFSEKGSQIILSDGTFTLYEMYGVINENKISKIPLRSDFSIDLPAMLKSITADTSAFFICNPNNPTGLSFSYEELDSIFSQIPNSVGIFLDEAYIFYSRYQQDDLVKNLIQKYPNLFVLRTFSKIGLAGARIGYCISNAKNIELMNRVRPPFNINAEAMNLAFWILDETKYLQKIKRVNQQEKQLLSKHYQKLNLKFLPSDTNFILVQLNPAIEKKLEKKNILIRNTKSFGLPSDYYRITIGNQSENKKLIKALEEVLQ